MEAAEVNELLDLLEGAGVDVWLTGGWGIDALLGRETRRHHDLDVLVRAEHLDRARGLLHGHGFRLREIWPENRWLGDSRGGPEADHATAFVLRDAEGRDVDVHVVAIDADGEATPLWDTHRRFSASALRSRGSVGGRVVSCVSAAMQIVAHQDYELPPEHAQDLRLLLEHVQDADGPGAA